MRKGSKVAGRAPRSRSTSRRAAIAQLARPSLAIALLVTGLVLASAFVGIEAQRNALAREAAAYRADIAAAEATHAQLGADVAAKKTDDYVINKAREYGYVLPGEALIGVQQDPVAPVVAMPVAGPSRVQKWIALFFGTR